MPRVIIVAMLVLLLIPLCAGCAPGTPAADPGANLAPLAGNYSDALPISGQLIVGTFRLETTSQAVTAAQAAELLPLWKAYRSLGAGSSASPLELQSLLQQIHDTLSAEQLAAIASMALTRDDLFATMQVRGLGMAVDSPGTAPQTQRSSSSSRGGSSTGGPGGGMPGGGPGGGFPGGGPTGGFPGAGPAAPAMPDTGQVEASRAEGVGGAGLAGQGPLLEALIALLAAKG